MSKEVLSIFVKNLIPGTVKTRLAEDLGVETTLQQVGIRGNDLDLLADEAMKQQRLLPNNPRSIQRMDALGIYEAALE